MHPLTLLAALRGRLRALFRRTDVERDFSAEIRFHLDMETQKNVALGMRPDAARRSALLTFGGVERMREEHRDARGTRFLEDMIADLRYAFRWLRRSSGFTTSAVLTLALGIGGTTAVFCVVDGILLQPLPYRDPGRLVAIWSLTRSGGADPWATSPPDFRELRAHATAFEGIGAYFSTAANLVIGEEPVRLEAARTTAATFEILGVPPLLGRAFQNGDEMVGNDRVVLLSHGAWTTRFGASPSIVGSALRLNGQPHTVIGVMPPSFRFLDRRAEIWLPMAFATEDALNTRGNYFLNIVGRIRTGTGAEVVRADLARVVAQVVAQYPQASMNGLTTVPLHEQTVGESRKALLLLLAATGLLLTIACANVAGLLLARAAGRGRELAVRQGLGATRGRLVRQLLTEGTLLSAAGALCGILIAAGTLRLLRTLGPTDIPRMDEVAVDGRVLIATVILSLLSALAFGVWPALRLTRGTSHEALRAGARSSSTMDHQRLRRVLVGGQVALALVLLAGSGLLLRSFLAMTRVDPGFRAANVVTASLPIRTNRYPDAVSTYAFADRLLESVIAVPQVESAALTSGLSLRGGGWGKQVTLADRALPSGMDQVPAVGYRLVSPDYFRTLGVRRISGRTFETGDRAGTQGVAVLNETMAKRFWPKDTPLGKTIWMGPPEEMIASRLPPGFRFPRLLVVGVVADERFEALDQPPQPEVYQLYSQSTETSPVLYLAVRSRRDPASLVGDIRAVLRQVEPAMPLAEIATGQQLLRESGARRRFSALLVTGFAILALSLAVVGIYGVAAQFVTQRTRELGIRMALGAGESRVLGLVLGEGLRTSIVGMVVGLAAAFALGGVMRDMIFGVTPTDPVTYVAITGILLAAVLLATLLPARRATRIPPALVLRGE